MRSRPRGPRNSGPTPLRSDPNLFRGGKIKMLLRKKGGVIMRVTQGLYAWRGCARSLRERGINNLVTFVPSQSAINVYSEA